MCQNCTNVKAFGIEKYGEDLHALEVPRREVGEHDIEMEILYCGICHSDLHQLKGDFGAPFFPLVVGHEIVGKITKVGSEVSLFAVGDLAGIGCIIDSCRECEYCKAGLEQYCVKGITFSFNSPDLHTGKSTYGGFSEKYICDEKYVLKMPAFHDLPASTPLLCAGITVYSPLRHWNTGPEKKVGVLGIGGLGIGGLGHLAIKIAKAMGAEVTILTHSEEKIEDAKRLGAEKAILTQDATQMKDAVSTLDLIIDTVSAKHDINTYLSLLKPEGSLALVGLPIGPLEVFAFPLVHGRKSFSGSNIGGIAETQEMLDFCAEHNITADIELIRVEDVNEALERLEKGDVKYRFVIDMKTL